MEGLLILIMPILISVWFIVALNDFFKCPKDDHRRQKLKKQLIISSVVFGIMVLAIVGLGVILSLAIMNM